MNIRSAKAKGRRLQDHVAQRIAEALNLDEDDIKTAIMGESGVDIHLSPKAKSVFPFSVECKNTERFQLWQYWDQAKSNSVNDTWPMVVTKKNRSEVLAIVRLDDLLDFISELLDSAHGH